MDPTAGQLEQLRALVRRRSRALAYWAVAAAVSGALSGSAVVLYLVSG